MHRSNKGFSLVEILIGILIVTTIMIAAFQALSAVGIAKVKIIEQSEIEKQAYFSSERLFELIKKGGTLDYEEYWNRYSYDATFSSGSFLTPSGFGNFGNSGNPTSNSYADGPYNCISNGGGASMGTNGCVITNNRSYDLLSVNDDYRGQPQRYSQYQRQFIDRNSDNDTNNGDENGDGSIFGDDDDLFLGIGPKAFSGSVDENKVGELYLISNDGRERTYFRWRVETASGGFVPTGAICDYSNPSNPVGEACQGTIEMLKLVGVDYGYDHISGTGDSDGSEDDGLIDTWLIHEDYAGGNTNVVAGSNTQSYWQAIFPNTINIKDFEVYSYPNKDIRYSWRDNDPLILLSPYIQISYSIEPSLETKAKIIGESPRVDISTTIQLSNLDIK